MYLIIDVEATCWNDDQIHDNEIIEIGACIVDDKFQVVGERDIYVKPVVNPELSEFCTKLTGITTEQLESYGMTFPDAVKTLEDFCVKTTGKDIKEFEFISWGWYDKNQFSTDCKRHKIRYPFGKHRNVKIELSERKGWKKGGVSKCLQRMGMTFKGRPHNGADDAYNIARMFCKEWGGEDPESVRK